MRRMTRWAGNLEGLIPCLILLPLAWALLPGGLPSTADGKVHFVRAAEMIHAWQDGLFFPRWAQHLGFGYGIPLFVYVPPLPYFLTASFYRLGLAPEAAYKAMMLTGIVLAALGAYRLGRALLGVWAGVVTCAAFLYAPFFLRELFVQGNMPQYLAWSFAPWAVAALIDLYRTRRSRHALYLALALVGTILSHNVVALMMISMTAGLGLALFLTTHDRHSLARAAAGTLLGLALSAWFWVPALLEDGYVALVRVIASDFRPRFLAAAELLAWPARLDRAAINPYLPLTLGTTQVIAAWIGFAGWWILVRRAPRPHDVEDRVLVGLGGTMAVAAAFCAFMATRASEPVWNVLPFVNLFEFPSRWHGLTALALSWLAGAAAPGLARISPQTWRARIEMGLGSALLLALLWAGLVYLYPHKLPPGTRSIAPVDVVGLETKNAAVGSTSLGEYNPIWVQGPLSTSSLVDDYAAGGPIDRLPNPLPPGVQGRLLEGTTQRHRYQLAVDRPILLTLSLLYFPGWQATVDNRPLSIRPQPLTGLMEVEAPAGEYVLTLAFRETPLRRAMDDLSLLAWAGLGIGLTWTRIRRRARVQGELSQKQAETGLLPSGALPTVAASIVTVMVGSTLLVRALLPGCFQITSPPDRALPARVPLHVDFGGHLRLLGIDPAPEIVAPGSIITVVAYWRSLDDHEIDYAVYLHLDDPVTGETLATVDQMHPGGIPTSGWATGLYVRDPLPLAVPADLLPMQYVLRLGLYDRATGERLPVTAGHAPDGEIGRIWVEPRRAPRPPGGPTIGFGDSLELLGTHVDPDAATLTLYWRASAPLPADYSIFVHLLDDANQMIGQVDGAPYGNRYWTRAWRPGQIIVDRRDLASSGAPLAALQRITVGVYDPSSGVRLPAVNDQQARLADDALLLAWPR